MPPIRPLADDTDLHAERLQFEVWSRMTPSEKFAAFAELMELADTIAMAGLRRRYPDASEHELFLRRTATRLDRQTMIACYGWDPQEHL